MNNVIDDRLSIAKYDADGNVEYVVYGKTQAELLKDHEEGVCDMWCNHCYNTACEWIENLKK